MNRFITNKRDCISNQKHPTKKSPRPYDNTSEFYQMFKELTEISDIIKVSK